MQYHKHELESERGGLPTYCNVVDVQPPQTEVINLFDVDTSAFCLFVITILLHCLM